MAEFDKEMQGLLAEHIEVVLVDRDHKEDALDTAKAMVAKVALQGDLARELAEGVEQMVRARTGEARNQAGERITDTIERLVEVLNFDEGQKDALEVAAGGMAAEMQQRQFALDDALREAGDLGLPSGEPGNDPQKPPQGPGPKKTRGR